MEQAEQVKTRFNKSQGKCRAIFFSKTGWTSYDMSERTYAEFKKWCHKWLEPTGRAGEFVSGVREQERIKRMLLDHIAFPY